MRSLATVLVVCFAMMGCRSDPWSATKQARPPHPQIHAVFMDGTANDFESQTNVMKLYQRVSQLPADPIGAFYIEGVGAKDKYAGMATGLGFKYRIGKAYQYLLQNYEAGDDIYLFGFSRGAYSTRVLASLVHYGGLPSEPIDDPARAARLASGIFDAYKGDMSHEERKARIRAALRELGADDTFASRPIKFMGVWETVESMGLPNDDENVESENQDYADQLCNVQRAAHAMSLDDNRAWDFTPVLLTRRHLLEDCDTTAWGEDWSYTHASADARLEQTVDEVWFAGAHADVGGGYPDASLSAVSMNWMLAHLKAQGLFNGYEVHIANHTNAVHDPQQDMLDGHVYDRVWRDLERYAAESGYNGGKLKIHPTVFSRLSALRVEGQRSPAGLATEKFKACFRAVGDGRYVYEAREGCRLTVAPIPR